MYVELTSAAIDVDLDIIVDIDNNWIIYGNSTANAYALMGPLSAGDYHYFYVKSWGGTAVYNLNIRFLTEAQMGHISGRVTNGAGNGIPDTWVQVHLQDDEFGYTWGLRWTNTDADGYYAFLLPPGEYKVKFLNNELNYQMEWYNNKRSYNEADGVTVTAGSTTANIWSTTKGVLTKPMG